MKTFIRWILVASFSLTIYLFSANKNIPLNPYRDKVFNKLKPYVNYIYNNFDFVIKKIMHFSEYAILTLLIFYAVNGTKKIKNKYLWSFLIPVLFAISDEYHQSFVPTRHPRIFDVFVDTSGVIFMLIIIKIIQKLKN